MRCREQGIPNGSGPWIPLRERSCRLTHGQATAKASGDLDRNEGARLEGLEI